VGQSVILTPGISDQQSRASSGGAFAPEVSPDGRWLAFARQVPDGTLEYREHSFGPRTALWLRDLETGSERLLMDPIEKDSSEGEGALRVLPGYGWAPAGDALLVSQGGRLRRVELDTGRVTTLPFEAEVRREISEMARGRVEVSGEPFAARFIRWPSLSPPRTQLAFEAVGRIWIRTALSGAIRRLTPGDFGDAFELAPSWSPDGRWIAFVTSENRGGGHVWKVDTTGLARPVRLTASPGDYANPVWSADGRSVVVARGAGATARDRGMIFNAWFDLVRFPASGGNPTVLAATSGSDWDLWDVERRQLPRTSFDERGRMFFLDRVLEKQEDQQEVLISHLVSVAADGTDRRVHLRFPDADEAAVSPDGRRVLYQEADNIYLTALPGSSVEEPPLVDRRGSAWPSEVLTTGGGLFPRWLDNETVEYGMGRQHFLRRLAGGQTEGQELTVEIRPPLPEGRVAIANARLITSGKQGVIEKGSLLVQGRRILCVGECGVQGADWVIDATGRTVIPGLIDAHVHNNWLHRGVPPPVNMEAASYLALGVTTVMEPSAWSQNVFPVAELIEAGRMLGPRTFSTGDPLFRGDGGRHNRIESLADAEREIERLVSWGATALKQYKQPLREQRQWIAEIARERLLMLTGEGGDLAFTLGLIMDGQTGWEHPLPYAPIYSDVAQFFGMAGATYSATLGVGGPGPWNEEYFLANWPPMNSFRLKRLVPWRQLAPPSRRVIDRPKSDYSFPLIAESIKDLLDAGGNSALGSHGQQHGMAPHWEIWMLAEALGPVRALEVATLGGARFLGLEEELGSLEEGKVADLVVLASNPLEDIEATATVDLVMKAGTVWHAEGLVEAWPQTGVPTSFVSDAPVLDRGSRSVDYWDRQKDPQ
jgi:imidazolonepropionase-like amidohydrolase